MRLLRFFFIAFVLFLFEILLPFSMHPASAVLPSKEPFKIALVLRGKDDKSFNASAFNGLTKFANDHQGVFFKNVEAPDDNAFDLAIAGLLKMSIKFDLIFSIGGSNIQAVEKAAKKFPQQKFVIVDGALSGLPNVRSVVFKEHEGSFLVGFIAGKITKTAKLGFIGGMDIPLMRKFKDGFTAGAKLARADVQVVSHFVGVTGNAWNNPAWAKELAISQMNEGVDIIFAAAGASGSGVFDAVEEKYTKKHPIYVIGVDSNQNNIKPGLVLTSMVKEIGEAVYSISKDAKNGKFEAGVVQMGLANHGVGFAVDSANKKILPPQVLAQARKIEKSIIERRIEVPDYSTLKVK